MATGSKNAKSQSVTARIAHEIIDGMEAVKNPGESTGQFINSAMQGEIKRRQRKKAKEADND
ncbi:YlcI/YnfO family protein [Citrobacter freundii]|nr:YlcI/YnfO family protein [Citrobacter freundii]